MFKKSLITTFVVFFILMFVAPIVKNKTRILEKDIKRLNIEISVLQKQLNEAQIEFVYLSSPEKLKIILDKSKDTTYSSFDRSRIFLSTADFENLNKKTTKKY